MPSTTAKGVPYPVGTDAAASIDTIVQSLADWVNAAPGIASVTTAERNALTGAALWNGRIVYNNQTVRLEMYNGSVWTTDVVAVGSNALVDLAVTTAKLADNAVTTLKILDAAITTAKLADGGVSNAKLASGIDAAKITTGILPDARILDGSILNAKLASGIDAGKLTTGTLPVARIADNSVTGAKITSDSTSVTQSSQTIYLRRFGHMVFATNNQGGAISAGTYSGLIPAGWRPVRYTGVHTDQTGSLAGIDGAGTLYVVSGSAFVSGAWSTL